MTTDWSHALKTRAETIRQQLNLLDDEIVLAHAAGLSWRKIGEAADMNHEKARQAAARIAKRASPDPPPSPAEPEGP